MANYGERDTRALPEHKQAKKNNVGTRVVRISVHMQVVARWILGKSTN